MSGNKSNKRKGEEEEGKGPTVDSVRRSKRSRAPPPKRLKSSDDEEDLKKALRISRIFEKKIQKGDSGRRQNSFIRGGRRTN